MIRLERKDGLWRAVIAREEKANSLTRAMLTEQLQNGERALGSWSQGVVRGSDEGFFEHSKFRNVSGFGILACVSDTA